MVQIVGGGSGDGSRLRGGRRGRDQLLMVMVRMVGVVLLVLRLSYCRGRGHRRRRCCRQVAGRLGADGEIVVVAVEILMLLLLLLVLLMLLRALVVVVPIAGCLVHHLLVVVLDGCRGGGRRGRLLLLGRRGGRGQVRMGVRVVTIVVQMAVVVQVAVICQMVVVALEGRCGSGMMVMIRQVMMMVMVVARGERRVVMVHVGGGLWLVHLGLFYFILFNQSLCM